MTPVNRYTLFVLMRSVHFLGNILKNAGREKFSRFGSFMAKGQELCVRECIDFWIRCIMKFLVIDQEMKRVEVGEQHW